MQTLGECFVRTCTLLSCLNQNVHEYINISIGFRLDGFWGLTVAVQTQRLASGFNSVLSNRIVAGWEYIDESLLF